MGRTQNKTRDMSVELVMVAVEKDTPKCNQLNSMDCWLFGLDTQLVHGIEEDIDSFGAVRHAEII